MQRGFIFDLNKCTGCGACQIACSLENEVSLPINWRQVNTFNSRQFPEIPYHHLSMACNHCLEAPCITYCPTLAISRNEETGAVLINDNKCIGCGYCSWVCPYDAPKFNKSTGVMEKCTFCQHRLEENLPPACVSLCPTTALQIENFEYTAQSFKVNGFTQTDIKPAIRLIGLTKERPTNDQSELPFDKTIIEKYRELITFTNVQSKINLKEEWPLIIFTLLSPLLAGLLTARLFTSGVVNVLLLVFMGLGGFLISGFHLGKKWRAITAILNWRQSWLSREILTYALFLILMIPSIFVVPQSTITGWLGVGFIFLSLYSIDQVYNVLPLQVYQKYHSANAFLTGLFWACLFTFFSPGIIIFGTIKLFLYLKRKLSGYNKPAAYGKFLSFLRVTFGFVIPASVWILSTEIDMNLIIFCLLTGEIIDRSEFYLELDLITPAQQMKADLEQAIKNNR